MPPSMRVDVKVTPQGMDAIRGVLEKLPDKVTTAFRMALRKEAEQIMTRSRQEVPVDTGALRSTGFVSPVNIGFYKAEVELGYGGFASNGKDVGYAVYVHENLDAYHEVGKAKFLEDPVRAAQEGMGERLVGTVQDYLKRHL